MKVTIKPISKVFQPMSVTFTLETQKELDALGTLFNSCRVIDGMGRITGDSSSFDTVYQRLESSGADVNLQNIFNGEDNA